MGFSEFVFVRTFTALRSMFGGFGASPAGTGEANPHTLLELILDLLDQHGLLNFEQWSFLGLQIATLGTHRTSAFRRRIRNAISQPEASLNRREDFSELLGNRWIELLTLHRSANLSHDEDARSFCTEALKRRLIVVQPDLIQFLSKLLCVTETDDITDRLHEDLTAGELVHFRTISSLVDQSITLLIHRESPLHHEQLFRHLLNYCIHQLAYIRRDADFTRFIENHSRDRSESLFLHAVHHAAVGESSRKIILATVYGGFPVDAFIPADENAVLLSQRQGAALKKLILAWRSISVRF